MKILFLTSHLPFGRRNGGEVCSLRLVRLLSELGHEVHVAARATSSQVADLDASVPFSVLGGPVVEFAHLTLAEKLSKTATAFVKREALSVDRLLASTGRSILRSLLDEQTWDVVLVDHLQTFACYKSLLTPVRSLALVAHNVEPVIYRHLAESVTSRWARFLYERESKILERHDADAAELVGAVFVLTEPDREHYRALVPREVPVHVLPSFGYLSPSPFMGQRPNRSVGIRVGLIGTWTWQSNRAGLDWFLREVVPLLESKTEIVIAGKGLENTELPSSVRYLGFVPSVADFYRNVDVVAIPATQGGGVQEKTVEAIVCSSRLVASPLAVRGLHPLPAHTFVTSKATEFAKALENAPRSTDVLSAEVWNDDRRHRYLVAVKEALSSVAAKV
jgi:polysaccharide biosynthesis protein PslH